MKNTTREVICLVEDGFVGNLTEVAKHLNTENGFVCKVAQGYPRLTLHGNKIKPIAYVTYKNVYRLEDRSGKTVFIGNTEECAKFANSTEKRIRGEGRRGHYVRGLYKPIFIRKSAIADDY